MEAWCVPGKNLTSVPYHRQFLWVLCFFSQIFLGKFSVTNNLQTLVGQQNQGFFILQVIYQLDIYSKSSAMFHSSCPLESRLLWSSYLVLMAEGKMKWLEFVIALKTSFQSLIWYSLWLGQGPWPCLGKHALLTGKHCTSCCSPRKRIPDLYQEPCDCCACLWEMPLKCQDDFPDNWKQCVILPCLEIVGKIVSGI